MIGDEDPWQLPHRPPKKIPKTLPEKLFHLIDSASFQPPSYSAAAAAAVMSAGWRAPVDPVDTPADLAAQPLMTVIIIGDGSAWQAGVLDGYDTSGERTHVTVWRPVGMSGWSDCAEPHLLPALVVWRPAE